MQPPLDAPRDGLTIEQVGFLLGGSSDVRVQYGVDCVDQTFAYVADLTPYCSGGELARDNYATVHGSCTLILDSDAPINFGTQWVRPWMVLRSQGVQAQWYLGVYTLTSPQRDLTLSPSADSVTGYDLLYFLNQPIGDSAMVAAGSEPINAAVGAIHAAMGSFVNVTYTPNSTTLAADKIWVFDQTNSATTWLTLINDLCAAAGYRGVWVDWWGTFHLEPYYTPASLGPEWTFDYSSTANIIAPKRTQNQDVWGVPNWWRFVQNGVNGQPVEGVSQYTYQDDSLTNPGSVPNRGRRFPKVVNLDATDFNALKASAWKTITADLAPGETFDHTLSPFPMAWHFDQAVLIDPALEGLGPLYSKTRRVQAKSWKLPLAGGDGEYLWETVTQ